jgi:CBS domain-containing protein
MQIKEAMCTNFKIIKPQTTLKEAAQAMRECDCGYLPVGENDRLTGAVTDRDITIRAISDGLDPNTTTVSDIMTEKVVYCFEEDDIDSAAQTMKDKQIRRLVVLNKDKRMTGVLTVGDIARVCHDHKLTGSIENEVAKAA